LKLMLAARHTVDQGMQEAGSAVLRWGGVTGERAQRNGTTGLKNELLIKDLPGGLNALSYNILSVSFFLSPSFCFPAGKPNNTPSHPNSSSRETLAFESFLLH